VLAVSDRKGGEGQGAHELGIASLDEIRRRRCAARDPATEPPCSLYCVEWSTEKESPLDERRTLPELLDARHLTAELGVTRAEAIMRQLPVVKFEGLRKVYVRRGDVRRLLEERTFTKDQCAA
jgi:hypothetical protein